MKITWILMNFNEFWWIFFFALSTNFWIFSSGALKTQRDLLEMQKKKIKKFFFEVEKNSTKSDFSHFRSNFWICFSMIFRHFWDVEARLGRVLAFREERIQKFVDRRDFWPFENLQNFLHFLLKEKWVIHFATFSAATHPIQVFSDSAGCVLEGAIVCG